MLNFYIYFTPGTVRGMRLFTLSLLKHTRSSTFTLVSNGCRPAEAQLLQDLAVNHERLTFFQYPSADKVPHATLIEATQQRESTEYFCFLDSDVLATGDFVAELTPLLSEYQGVFSGRNLWELPGETLLTPEIKRVSGPHSYTPAGLCLGGTYCAIYDNLSLKAVLQQLNPPFPIWYKRTWNNIPRPYRRWLAAHDLQRDWFDTGKLVNALMHMHGHRLIFQDVPSLHHLGGMSIYQWHTNPDPDRLEFWHRRTATGQYLYALFASLYDNTPRPALPAFQEVAISAQLAHITEQIQALYTECSAELIAAEQAAGYIHNPAWNTPQPMPANGVQRNLSRWLHRRRSAWLPPGSARERWYEDFKRRVLP